ncbi:MAG TPA: hypothetical protein VGJ26_04490 [Pirellulales bacterium]|jgi:hypothetical protein
MQEVVRQKDSGMSFRAISDYLERIMALYEGRRYRSRGFRGKWGKSVIHRAYHAEKEIQARENAVESEVPDGVAAEAANGAC